MAYNGVGIPRFYIDEVQYLQSVGFDFEKYYEDNYYAEEDETRLTYLDNPSLFGLSPENQQRILMNDYIKAFDTPAIINNIEGNNIGRYTAILNHKLSNIPIGANSTTAHFRWASPDLSSNIRYENNVLNTLEPYNNGCTIINFNPTDDNFNPPEENMFNRLGLYTSLTGDELEQVLPINIDIGSISQGIYYDLRSPDLDIEMTTEFDGFSSTKTLGGSTITNVRYAGSPWWYDVDKNKVEPWSVGESTGITKRNGRRVWNLKFSYLADTDVFASNYMSNKYYEHSSSDSTDSVYNDAGDLSDDSNDFRYTLEEDNSFIAQVINRIGNGQRFIFQPDKNNNNPDQFAICMLDKDEFSITQVAHRTYSFDLKIREVW